MHAAALLKGIEGKRLTNRRPNQNTFKLKALGFLRSSLFRYPMLQRSFSNHPSGAFKTLPRIGHKFYFRGCLSFLGVFRHASPAISNICFISADRLRGWR